MPLSRFSVGAIERELRLRAGRTVVQQWQAEHGAFTPQELASAYAEMAAADAAYLIGSTPGRHLLPVGGTGAGVVGGPAAAAAAGSVDPGVTPDPGTS
ncbi:hypothetical protein [Plantactinospora sp. B5E13]|uniref:hypothetical protein n=1 Tax=unclassified Plantactinospora TaxID=2631981 RepID=UPI00325E46EF